MDQFSEEYIQKHCPHCGPQSFALAYKLQITNNFWIVCDGHPLREGHILLIPKQHLSCVGEYPLPLFNDFLRKYRRISDFLLWTYWSVASFEHGVIGQTVFHSHVHFLPFDGKPEDIIEEGFEYLTAVSNLSALRTAFRRDGKYLFFSIGSRMWLVDTRLGSPRFFRDRFANALGVPQKGNWRAMRADEKLMVEAENDMQKLKQRWARSKSR